MYRYCAIVVFLVACETLFKSGTHDLVVNTEHCGQVNSLAWVQAGAYPGSMAKEVRSCLTKTLNDQEIKVGGDAVKDSELSEVSHPFGVTHKNKVDLDFLTGGRDIFARATDAILQAQKEILIRLYEWDHESRNSKALISALRKLHKIRKECKVCRDPLTVKILADDSDGADAARNVKNSLSKIRWNPEVLDIEVIPFSIGKNSFISPIIVDGQFAIMTSAQPSLGYDHTKRLYTNGLIVVGDSVRAIRKAFAREVVIAKGGDDYLEMSRLYGVSLDVKFAKNPGLSRILREPYDQSGHQPVVYTSAIHDDNDLNRNRLAFKALLTGAKNIIRIQASQFNDESLVKYLAAAIGRGVKVQILLNQANLCKDLKDGRESSLSFIKKLLEQANISLDNHQLDVRWVGRLNKGAPIAVTGEVDFSKKKWPSGYNTVNSGSVDNEMIYFSGGTMDSQKPSSTIFLWGHKISKTYFRNLYRINFEKGIPVKSVAEDEYCKS